MVFYDYFQSYNNYFWQWEENADVLAIPKDNTIAYSEFVTEILEILALQGLPPFGSLLLAIIATNPKGDKSIDTVYAILCDTLKTVDNVPLSNTIEFLKLFSELPEEYKKGKKRVLLFQALFENCHNITSIKNSKAIVKDYAANKFDKNQFVKQIEFNHGQYEKDFRTIEVLKNKFKDINDIIVKIASLPEIQEDTIKLNNPSDETETKEFTEQLIDNPKTFRVGSLVKRIWSGLNIPVHSALPSQQPIGGVSDLTNKGDFDKLLISEFANDDIVFLSRLANNEALFIRREIPPANNNLERVILIDVSLKNWGTPKAIAFATMLAIAKHPKTNIACSAFVIGNSFYPISIDSLDSIIDGLQILEGTLNPVNGLTAFFKEHPANKNREIFIITEPSTLKQAAMVKAMTEYHSFINYWIYTDADGNIDVYKKQQSSKKHIQHIQLPLELLWKKEFKATGNVKQRNESITSYPILFRNSLNSKKILTTPLGETFQITGDKALLRFFEKLSKPYEKGWEVIIENLPFANGEYEIGMLPNGEHILLMFNQQNRELSLLNINTQETKSLIFNDWKATSKHSFIFQDQKFYHLNHKGCWCIHPNGTLESDSIIEKKIVTQRNEELQKSAQNFLQGQGFLKNIKEIFINEDNHLVFNIHELLINKGSHIKIDQTNNRAKKTEATKINDTEFTFNDGSSITINRSGMLILKSSDTHIPIIYIPSLLNASLGVATDEDFAGNDYYYIEPQFELILENAGENRITIIKLIKEITERGLDDVHRLVHAAPIQIIQNVSKIKADLIQKTLEKEGASVKINRNNIHSFELEKISTLQFFEKHINPFVNHILSHGTKN